MCVLLVDNNGWLVLINQHRNDFLQVRSGSNRKSGPFFFKIVCNSILIFVKIIINAHGIIYMNAYIVF